MISEVLFSQDAFIEVQGAKVFNLIELNKEFALYEIEGFQFPRLTIMDYRRDVNNFLEKILDSNDIQDFAYVFCRPADLILEKSDSGDLNIKLYNSTITIPSFMVWIVSGLEGQFPEYPFIFQEVQSIDDNTFSGMTIYPLSKVEMEDFINSSANASIDI